jgi:hypothetical protein
MTLKFAISFALAVSLCGAAPVYYLGTGQNGAQTQVDVNHTSTWLFTPNIAFDLGGGLFQMKDGPKTSADIVLSVFLGSDATGTLLGAVSLTHTDFCAQVNHCNQFDSHQFFFDNPIHLAPGVTYFGELTSVAADAQTQAYFIKEESNISDRTGTPIDPQPIGSNSNAAEPASMVLTGLGFLICGIGPRFRRRTRASITARSAGRRRPKSAFLLPTGSR